ncbi:hypothetical protein AM587_10005836 [Phytophthora nicotianae]|uniref:Uncharacterized protein n=1 Tax=Phytophthora nicotianae TaxID=4792 RepID=A0A0W8DQS8_PHYNI|nr:hypothetical protein AM587_10005836 [Phytophthora nicotianae]
MYCLLLQSTCTRSRITACIACTSRIGATRKRPPTGGVNVAFPAIAIGSSRVGESPTSTTSTSPANREKASDCVWYSAANGTENQIAGIDTTVCALTTYVCCGLSGIGRTPISLSSISCATKSTGITFSFQ